MYKVFFNEKKIVITQSGNKPFVKTAVIIDNLSNRNEVKKWFLEFVNSDVQDAYIIHSSPKQFWETVFIPAFKFIEAAGGVVFRKNKLLFIFRSNKWDLPKGKIDNGESSNEAAIREVAEECGIEGHEIVKKLPSTFHIYKSPYIDSLGQWILKETHWFEMIYSGLENGVPETKENITKIKWLAKNEIEDILKNTYRNLKQIIKLYLG